MFTYNINNKIKVKLTDHGKAILEHEVTDMVIDLHLPNDYTPYPEDEEGYTEFQLWNFMEIFGKYVWNGRPAIIEKNKIIFIDEVN